MINEYQNYYVTIFSFGLTPARPLQVLNPLLPTASCEASLPLATSGLVQRMEPITNLQVHKYFNILYNKKYILIHNIIIGGYKKQY